MVPRPAPITNDSGTANPASISVLASAPPTSSATGRRVATERPKSPCAARHSQFMNCTGKGLSKP